MATKVCKRCGEEKPTTEYHKHTHSKDGLNYICKLCASETRKEYRKKITTKNKTIDVYENKLMKRCCKCHEVKPSTEFNKHNAIKDGLDSYCRLCTSDIKKHEDKQAKSRVFKNWYYKNKDNEEQILRSRTNKRLYYYSHREEMLEYTKEWTNKNRDKYRRNMRKAAHKRNSLKKSIVATLTNDEWAEILIIFDNSCAYCGKKNTKLEQDHVIPISKGGEYTKENIVPACVECNRSKSDNDVIEWINSDKLNKIKRKASIY